MSHKKSKSILPGMESGPLDWRFPVFLMSVSFCSDLRYFPESKVFQPSGKLSFSSGTSIGTRLSGSYGIFRFRPDSLIPDANPKSMNPIKTITGLSPFIFLFLKLVLSSKINILAFNKGERCLWEHLLL